MFDFQNCSFFTDPYGLIILQLLAISALLPSSLSLCDENLVMTGTDIESEDDDNAILSLLVRGQCNSVDA